MKRNHIVFVLGLTILLSACKQEEGSTPETAPVASETELGGKPETPWNSSQYIKDATQAVEVLIGKNQYTPFDVLQSQKLDRIEENSGVLVSAGTDKTVKTGNQMYHYLKERTMYMGSSYLCTRCPNTHLNSASGFIIHEDGILVTNYHVIEVKEGLDVSGIFAIDHEGTAYPVSGILAASQSNDIAVLQLDVQGKKLKHLPVAEQEWVGEDVFMMGHPFSNIFYMSKGIIARKYLSEHSGEPKIAITADFGQGASGGPVVNAYGEVVGVVSATYVHYTNGSKKNGDLQMVVKEVVPVSALNEYVERK